MEQSSNELSKRIKEAREAKGWNQKKLAEESGILQKQISAYENGNTSPTLEKLIGIANTLGVSTDYLLGARSDDNVNISVKDRELLARFEQVDQFNEEERALAKSILDLVITKHQVQKAVSA